MIKGWIRVDITLEYGLDNTKKFLNVLGGNFVMELSNNLRQAWNKCVDLLDWQKVTL